MLAQTPPASLARYPPTKGSPELRSTIADWVKARYHLPALNPETQMLPVVGTKEAIYSFTQTVRSIRARRTPLFSYPIRFTWSTKARDARAQPYYVNLDASTGQYAWDAIPESVWRDVQLVLVCSPDNPTGFYHHS